jgi:hypothetical protein
MDPIRRIEDTTHLGGLPAQQPMRLQHHTTVWDFPSRPSVVSLLKLHQDHQAFRKLNQAGALSYLRTYHPRNQLLIQLTDKGQMNIL